MQVAIIAVEHGIEKRLHVKTKQNNVLETKKAFNSFGDLALAAPIYYMEREQKEEGIVRSDLCIPVHHDTDTDFVDYFFPRRPRR